jgi:hypothetical protein
MEQQEHMRFSHEMESTRFDGSALRNLVADQAMATRTQIRQETNDRRDGAL